MKNITHKTLALALGGGSALGFAHIGFLQILEENHIQISGIAGTSMGSLVGAFFVSGYSAKQLEEIALKQIYVKDFVFDFKPITFLKDGLISGVRMQNIFNKFFYEKNIEELSMKYASVAVDILSGKPYIFKTGNLARAVRASISIPSIFKPVKEGDMLLVDGGVIDNIPADHAKAFGFDKVISVDVLGDYNMKTPPKTITGLILASFTLLQYEYYKYKPNVADLKIKMNVEGVRQTDFNKKAIIKAIKVGRECANNHLEEIKKLIEYKEE